MPLPAVGGSVALDIDPTTFPGGTQVDGTALTFANSGLTPVTGSPTYETGRFDTGAPAIHCVQGASGFSYARPVSNDFSIYVVARGLTGAGSGAQFYQNGSFIDCEAAGVVNDFGINLRADGTLIAGTGNPDTSVGGTANIGDGLTHIVAVTRVKATGVLKVYVDDVLDITVTNNTSSLTASSNVYFGNGSSTQSISGDYGRIVFYDAAHSNADRLSVTAYLTTTYGDTPHLRSTKSVSYGVLGPPLLLSSTKSVMYVITGPGRQRVKVRLLKSIPI